MKINKQFNYFTFSVFLVLISYLGTAQAVWTTNCVKIPGRDELVQDDAPRRLKITVGNTIRQIEDIKTVEFDGNKGEIVGIEPVPDAKGYNYTDLEQIVGKSKENSYTHWSIKYIEDIIERRYDLRYEIWEVDHFHYSGRDKLHDQNDRNISGSYKCGGWADCSSCGVS